MWTAMRARAWGWLVVLAAVMLTTVSCRRVSERTLRDTEGRTLEARCDREQGCTLKAGAGQKADAQQVELALRATGRLVGVCSVGPASEPKSPSDCRALVCSGDADCPPAHGSKDGHCVNGLCVEPSGVLGTDDAVMLCLAGTGLGRESPEQVSRFAMALNCGSPCKIPSVCRQP
jgi:hypothetical protein